MAKDGSPHFFSQLPVEGEGLELVKARVDHPQQAVGAELEVEIGAGHHEGGNVPRLVFLADAAQQLAGAVKTIDHPVARRPQANTSFSPDRQAGEPGFLFAGFHRARR